MSYRILTIDPGSTSTKIGVFDDEKMLFEENLHHSAEELAQFETIPQQEAFRRRLVLKALEEHHIPLERLWPATPATPSSPAAAFSTP